MGFRDSRLDGGVKKTSTSRQGMSVALPTPAISHRPLESRRFLRLLEGVGTLSHVVDG